MEDLTFRKDLFHLDCDISQNCQLVRSHQRLLFRPQVAQSAPVKHNLNYYYIPQFRSLARL